MSDVSSAALDELVELFAELLAPLVADELAKRLEPPSTSGNGFTTDGLITLDELVCLLPPAKKPETWKRWLYERLRRGEVRGAVKLGGSWFFDRARVRQWLEAGDP